MPTFVGASTVYGSSSAWPSSMSFGTSDLAAGTVTGDRLVLFVTVDYSQRKVPLPVDTTLGSFDGLADWDFVSTAQFSASFLGRNTFTQIWTYTTRYAAGVLPLTVTPLDPLGNPYTPTGVAFQNVYRLTMAAWRPSYGWSGRANAAQEDGQASAATLSPDTGISVTGEDAGQFVQANFLSTNDMGAVVTDNGFTVRYTQPSIANKGGSLTISDKEFTSTGSTSAITLTKPTGCDGAVVLLALDQLDPSLGGWSVGQIKY